MAYIICANCMTYYKKPNVANLHNNVRKQMYWQEHSLLNIESIAKVQHVPPKQTLELSNNQATASYKLHQLDYTSNIYEKTSTPQTVQELSSCTEQNNI